MAHATTREIGEEPALIDKGSINFTGVENECILEITVASTIVKSNTTNVFSDMKTPWELPSNAFSKWDLAGFGEMDFEQLQNALLDPYFRCVVEQVADIRALQRLEYRAAVDSSPLTFHEFTDIITNKRRQSLEIAISSSMLEKHTISLPLLHPISRCPKQHRCIKIPMIYYENEMSINKVQNSCTLPNMCTLTPIFIPIIVSLQIALFIYYSMLFHTVPSLSAPIPVDSVFVFRSDNKHEVWRYFCYAFVHAGWWHLIFNVSVELFIGIPLEINVGTFRTSIVFISGVLAGSLVTAILEHGVSLMGASGGVYALLALHIANVLFNSDHVDCALWWIIVAVFVVSCDTAFAIFDHYTATKFVIRHTAYATHLVGAIAGFSLGLVLLRRSDEKYKHRSVNWIALAFYVVLMLTAIVYNIFAI